MGALGRVSRQKHYQGAWTPLDLDKGPIQVSMQAIVSKCYHLQLQMSIITIFRTIIILITVSSPPQHQRQPNINFRHTFGSKTIDFFKLLYIVKYCYLWIITYFLRVIISQ